MDDKFFERLTVLLYLIFPNIRVPFIIYYIINVKNLMFLELFFTVIIGR